MMSVLRLNNSRVLQSILRQNINKLNRNISNSPKNRSEAAICEPTEVTAKKPWVSYGFDYKSESNDRSSLKASFFFSVTLCLVWGSFIWAYLPDPRLRDWAQREGFLELRRREAAGLDLVNPNYIDPENMNLPSDEELGSTEIII